VKIHAGFVPVSFPVFFLWESRIDSLIHQLDNFGFGHNHSSLQGFSIDEFQCLVILTDSDVGRDGGVEQKSRTPPF